MFNLREDSKGATEKQEHMTIWKISRRMADVIPTWSIITLNGNRLNSAIKGTNYQAGEK